MNLKYLPDNDLMYIYFEMNIPNIQTRTKFEDIYKFVAKADKNKIIGYEIEGLSQNLERVLTDLNLNRKQRLAVCLFYLREKDGKTQKEFASLLGISESAYKSLEKAEHNTGFDTIEVIFEKFEDQKILGSIFGKAG